MPKQHSQEAPYDRWSGSAVELVAPSASAEILQGFSTATDYCLTEQQGIGPCSWVLWPYFYTDFGGVTAIVTNYLDYNGQKSSC